MEWSNLKDGYCPQCYFDLDETETTYTSDCGFTITKKKFDQIVGDMEKRDGGDDGF